MASSALPLSLPLSSLSRSWDYDVFPSFHGPDVRKGFLSHVQKEFERKGIATFIDNNINRGEFIGPELKRAIQESKIAIVMLSKNYASSSWCLDELVEIMINKVVGQTVLTVFYEVDPTDVKKQTGEFGEVFKEICHDKTKEKTETWRKALEGVATIAGYHSKNWNYEADMIEEIADDISKMLISLAPSPNRLIGMGARMERMQLLLRLDLEDEVRMIGIWGPPGIGKSTIARAMFNQLSRNFKLSAIMEIRESYPKTCLNPGRAQLQLQNEMLSLMINHKGPMITHLGVAQERLKHRRVLLVLDDVDRQAQLDALAGDIQWFGPGSRIIVTTEDRRILNDHGINHIYKVDYPLDDEALQIFCMHTFGQNSPYDGFEKLARKVTELSGKLPLGLRVMGSYFRGKSKDEWTWALPELQNRLNGEIESILKFSYDALCDKNKELFLYIACFFNHEEVDKVEGHLAKKFLDVRQRLQVLIEKSLISIDECGRIEMHSLLAQLGIETIREQSDREAGKQQFLVDNKDICEALIDPAAVNRSVIGISSCDRNEFCMRDVFNITKRAFKEMSNLQFLRLEGNIQIKSWRRRLKYISPKLQLLDWPHSPMRCLRCIINTEFLVELNMSYSKLKKLWEGVKPLQNLKWINLCYSKHLKKLPNLSTATNLQELLLVECISLVELPFSIGNARNLQKLNLQKCSSLVKLPSSMGSLTNLQDLYINGCSSLVELPSSIGSLMNLQKLDLRWCLSLVELPSSIGSLMNLQKLDLRWCSSLVELPSSTGSLMNLQKLDLSWCSSLVKLPSSIGSLTNLQKLNLSRCSSLVKLPSSIDSLTNLQKLNLSKCSSLVKLPSLIGSLTNLQKLELSSCSSLVKLPSSIGSLTNLQALYLNSCSSLVELPCSIGNATNLQEFNLQNCSSLVGLPSSIGNLHRLPQLDLSGCSKLEVLPTNINLESLTQLNLRDCSALKSFPEIAPNIEYLFLGGTAIEEVPSSIRSWSRLLKLSVSGCIKLVSLSQLPDSLENLGAENCVSLERLDCSFRNPNIKHLNFGKCFRLNQEERYHIIQTPTRKYSVLPGGEVPACFTYRAYGSSLTMELNEKPLRTSTKFKACILLDNKDEDEPFNGLYVECSITSKQKDFPVRRSDKRYLEKALTDHLYIFDFEAEEVTSSTELVFEFKLKTFAETVIWKVKECGILQL